METFLKPGSHLSVIVVQEKFGLGGIKVLNLKFGLHAPLDFNIIRGKWETRPGILRVEADFVSQHRAVSQ